MHLVLAVVPWHVLVTPSAAAGVLSAAVAPQHEVTTYYANLKFADRLLELSRTETDPQGVLDIDFLTTIADDGYVSGVAEWIFTQALYRRGEHRWREIEPAAQRLGVDPDALRIAHREAVRFVDEAAAEILDLEPDLVGLSTTFAQTTACLALARRIKQLSPGTPVVLGGSNCDGPMGAALHRSFPFVDYIVRREGERPLRALLSALALHPAERADVLAGIPGLCWWKEEGASCANPEPLSFPAGAELPAIEQSSYFAELAGSAVEQFIVPQLILESSRGCWWGQRKHCTFCGLSDLTIGFRSKPGASVVNELLANSAAHHVLDVMTSDNILDLRYFDEMLPQLAAADVDLDVFYELRVNLSADRMRLLRDAGVRHVQPGIENLHSAPLRLMAKGTTGVQNVAALRDFTENAITAGWNYLIGFPGETDSDYEEVLAQFADLAHLQPPNGAHRIFLERFNPYFESPERGFSRRAPLDWYRIVYPELPAGDLEELAYLFECDPTGISDATLDRLKAAIESWKQHFATSSLTHRRVGDALYIYDRRSTREPADYVLDDPGEVAAYERLSVGRPAERLSRDLVKAGYDCDVAWVDGFVAMLAEQGLVFTESGHAVTLSTDDTVRLERRAADPTSAAMASRT